MTAIREDVQAIVDRLAAAGGRRTAARYAIVETLLGAKEHITADDLAARVRERFPSINLSTVYRTLDTLEELGIVDHVHLGHGRAIYHLADEDHQHIVCERCQHIEELPLKKLKPFLQMVERDFGFQVDRRHFAIVGLCSRCR
jgi:Fur family transcriptional regulator, ferric uptake regulator